MIEIICIILVVLSAIILHEVAHGFVAYLCGDPTAKVMGRLTLNPIKHIDPVGTLLLPGVLLTLRMMGHPVFLLGWAKPVPVNFQRLRNPKRDMMWVGLAGPGTNIILAVLFRCILFLPVQSQMVECLEIGVFFNLLLAVFNMIPIPPLDGSRFVMGLLPISFAREYIKLEKYGIVIVFGLLYFGLFEVFVLPVIQFLGHILGVNFS